MSSKRRRAGRTVACMIELDTSHPKFSMPMEVLCSLPCHPVTVTLADLRDDMGMGPRQQNESVYPSIRRCLVTLRNAGHKINIKSDGGFIVSVDPTGWRRAKAEAQAYWNLIHDMELSHAP